MFRVADIEDETRKIIGVCDDAKFFRWCADVVTMIANKGDFEAFKGWIDLCSTGDSKCFTLPREVETVIAVNIGGRPTLGYGTLFSFHLNGPGDCCQSCQWAWMDQGAWHHVYRDITTPAKLVAQLQMAEDNGKELIVYGYDSEGNKLRRQVDGQWVDGLQIPTIYGVAVPDTTAPTVARITGIYKAPTAGSITLMQQDGIFLGVYEPDETIPQFRRIKINRASSWIRLAYMKKNPTFTSRFDHVPLRSRVGFLLGVQARKYYAAEKLAEAQSYEVNAVRLELEAQQRVEPNTTVSPVVVMDGSQSLVDKRDWDVS